MKNKKITDSMALSFFSAFLGVCMMSGCENSGSAILPAGNLTPEQLEKLKAEDAAIDESESQGKYKKPKGKK